MTPSASLAVAMRSPQFWLDYHGLGQVTEGTYEPLIGARAELRAGGHAIVLVFKSPTPHDDIPMVGFSLHVDGTTLALERRQAGPPPGARTRHYVLRWSELEAIARCAAIRDREPHPGATVALLARFAPICDGDDIDRAHAMLAAALRQRDLPDLAIDHIVRDTDLSGRAHWDGDPTRGWNLMGAPVHRRDHRFPEQAMAELVAAATADTASAAVKLRTPRAQMLAREVVDGDLSVAPLLAHWLRESGCTNHAIIDALELPEEPVGLLWVAEALADVPPGTARVPSTPFSFDERDVCVWCHSQEQPSMDAFRRFIEDSRVGSWDATRPWLLHTPPGPRDVLAARILEIGRRFGVMIWVSWRGTTSWRFIDPSGVTWNE